MAGGGAAAQTDVVTLVWSSKNSREETTESPIVWGKEGLEDLGDWQDHHDLLVHLVHQDEFLANLLQDVGQHKISASAPFLLAVQVCAVGHHTMVDFPTVQACPGVVGPVLGVVGEVVGDGDHDGGLWAGNRPVHWVT